MKTPSAAKPTMKTQFGATNRLDASVARNGATSRAIGSSLYQKNS